ncbi:hypothetical protein [Streptomyces sp. NPDC091219]|uniref:hypothetical protein n=1 Tax=Streptomyces sp. NPDC091219 TaxID=3155193 RepID=UPI00344C26AE
MSAKTVAAEPSRPAGTEATAGSAAGASAETVALAGSPAPEEPSGPGAGAPSGQAGRQEAEAEAPAAVLAASVPEGDGRDPGDAHAASVGRPGRPVLAGAAVLGALLIAVPGLLMSRDRTPESHDRVVADQAGTVLGGGDATQGAGAYASSSPSASVLKASPKALPHKAAPPKTSLAQPVSEPTAVKKAKKPAATPKPKKSTSAAKSGTGSTSKSTSSYPSDILVTATRVLHAGQSLNANKARLRMQTDGNFVLYDENNKARWATMTFGSNYHAVFQGDGNLVVYTADNRPVWASRTDGHGGATLRLQGDGNMVIYAGSTAIWATNTVH